MQKRMAMIQNVYTNAGGVGEVGEEYGRVFEYVQHSTDEYDNDNTSALVVNPYGLQDPQQSKSMNSILDPPIKLQHSTDPRRKRDRRVFGSQGDLTGNI